MAKNTENVTEVQMSPEETKANVRMYEDDILGGLMAAAAYKTDMDEVAKIQIIRHKAVVLEFRIRPLSEDEYVKIKPIPLTTLHFSHASVLSQIFVLSSSIVAS